MGKHRPRTGTGKKKVHTRKPESEIRRLEVAIQKRTALIAEGPTALDAYPSHFPVGATTLQQEETTTLQQQEEKEESDREESDWVPDWDGSQEEADAQVPHTTPNNLSTTTGSP